MRILDGGELCVHSDRADRLKDITQALDRYGVLLEQSVNKKEYMLSVDAESTLNPTLLNIMVDAVASCLNCRQQDIGERVQQLKRHYRTPEVIAQYQGTTIKFGSTMQPDHSKDQRGSHQVDTFRVSFPNSNAVHESALNPIQIGQRLLARLTIDNL